MALFHGVKKDIWKKKEGSILRFEKFLKNGPKIDHPEDTEKY